MQIFKEGEKIAIEFEQKKVATKELSP